MIAIQRQAGVGYPSGCEGERKNVRSYFVKF